MSIPNPGPLTEDHYTQISQALEVSKLAQQEIDRAKRAGIDVSDHEQRLKQAVDSLTRVRNTYFPGRG